MRGWGYGGGWGNSSYPGLFSAPFRTRCQFVIKSQQAFFFKSFCAYVVGPWGFRTCKKHPIISEKCIVQCCTACLFCSCADNECPQYVQAHAMHSEQRERAGRSALQAQVEHCKGKTKETSWTW